MSRATMRHASTGRIALPFTVALWFLAASLLAGPQGKLDAFESDVVGQGEDRSPDHSHDTSSGLADVFSDSMGELIRLTVAYGGVCSWERVSGGARMDGEVAPRLPGDALLPFARVDLSAQAVESDIEAEDLRVEGGYGPFGVHGDMTRFRESSPEDDLELTRILALYRMSYGSRVEVDVGLGTLTLDGGSTTTRLACSLPFLICPNARWAVEFRPMWSDRVSDYDLAVLWTRSYVALKAGYRWLDSPGESLDGPYAGLSFRL